MEQIKYCEIEQERDAGTSEKKEDKKKAGEAAAESGEKKSKE